MGEVTESKMQKEENPLVKLEFREKFLGFYVFKMNTHTIHIIQKKSITFESGLETSMWTPCGISSGTSLNNKGKL